MKLALSSCLKDVYTMAWTKIFAESRFKEELAPNQLEKVRHGKDSLKLFEDHRIGGLVFPKRSALRNC